MEDGRWPAYAKGFGAVGVGSHLSPARPALGASARQALSPMGWRRGGGIIALAATVLVAVAQESGRPYQGYEDLGDVTRDRGLLLEHSGTNFLHFVMEITSVFNRTNVAFVMKSSDLVTLSDFKGIEAGPALVRVHSLAAAGETSAVREFRVNVRRAPSAPPRARGIMLTNLAHERAARRPASSPQPPLPGGPGAAMNPEPDIPDSVGVGSLRMGDGKREAAVPDSGPLPISTPESHAAGRQAMGEFYARRSARGTLPPRRGGVGDHLSPARPSLGAPARQALSPSDEERGKTP